MSLFKYAKKNKIKVMVTPFDLKSLKICKRKEVDAIKIGSPDFDNIQLIINAFKLKKPLFLSTGMADDNEIDLMKINLIKYNIYNVPVTIFHCVSSYPPNEDEINLKYIKNLIQKFQTIKLDILVMKEDFSLSNINVFWIRSN